MLQFGTALEHTYYIQLRWISVQERIWTSFRVADCRLYCKNVTEIQQWCAQLEKGLLTKRWQNLPKCCWKRLYLFLIHTYLSAQVACMSKVCVTNSGQTHYQWCWHRTIFSPFSPLCYCNVSWPGSSSPSLGLCQTLSYVFYWRNMNHRKGDAGNGELCIVNTVTAPSPISHF